MNTNKLAISILCVTALWFGMDFVIHSMLLMGMYQETAHLWRPMAEMSHAVGFLATIIHAVLFVMFYQYMIKPKNLSQGLKFGCWVGLLIGLCMGCFYMFMPIPCMLACAWFVSAWLEYFVAGGVVGYFLKDA